MTIYDRPDEKVMAESALAGEVQPFPDILRGWGITFEQTGGLPPMEWANYVARRTDQAIRYFMQRGLPEWSATETYPQGAYVQYAFQTYYSKRENTNKQPGAAGSANDWGLWSVTRDEFDAAIHATRQQRFTSSGNFVVPAGVTTIFVSGCAGGSGGGGAGGPISAAGTAGGGGGGGAGQSIIRVPFAVTPGQVIPITIPAGGTGGAGGPPGNNGADGGSGGNTVIGTLVTLSQASGVGTHGNYNPSTPAGGNGGGGFPQGSFGSDGGQGATGGAGASGPFGGGGGSVRGGQTSAGAGIPAAGFGAGGGGGSSAYATASATGGAGGAGAPGFAMIEW